MCAKWQIRAGRKPIHLNFRKRNGWSGLATAWFLMKILQTTKILQLLACQMEKQGLQVDTTLSDHSVLSWRLKIPFSISKPVIKDFSQKVVKKILEHYMESPQCLEAFQSLTSLLDLTSGSRDDLELIYSKFCQTVERELIVRHQNPTL